MPFDIKTRIIYEVTHGSHAYGTAGPESDLDIRGIAVPPADYFLGFRKRFEQARGPDLGSDDTTIFDIRKFFKLAVDCNPNALELLWVPERCIRVMTPWGERLRAARKSFLSMRAREAFIGFAFSQKKRIENRKAAQDAGTPAPRENATRAALEAKYGYDTKYGSHLVRLLRMAEELFTSGDLTVDRPDKDELRAIKDGAWSYERLMTWADEMMTRVRLLEKSCTVLPQKPDIVALDRLCVEIVTDMLGFGPRILPPRTPFIHPDLLETDGDDDGSSDEPPTS